VGQALSCRLAVHVRLDGYGARITDSRSSDSSWLTARAFDVLTVVDVPVYRTVVRSVPSNALPSNAVPANGIPSTANSLGLDGLAPVATPAPAAVEQVLDHVEKRTVTASRDADVFLDAAWREVFLQWERFTDDVYLTLPAGAPFVAGGLGRAEQLCDPSVPMRAGLPDHGGDGFAMLCTLCTRPEDGWRVVWLDVSARLAGADEAATRGTGIRCDCPQAVNDLLALRVAALRFDERHAEQAPQAPATTNTGPGALQPQGGAATTPSMGPAAFAALVALAVCAGVAIACVAARRLRR
jgi:hypothetical protein